MVTKPIYQLLQVTPIVRAALTTRRSCPEAAMILATIQLMSVVSV